MAKLFLLYLWFLHYICYIASLGTTRKHAVYSTRCAKIMDRVRMDMTYNSETQPQKQEKLHTLFEVLKKSRPPKFTLILGDFQHQKPKFC